MHYTQLFNHIQLVNCENNYELFIIILLFNNSKLVIYLVTKYEQ